MATLGVPAGWLTSYAWFRARGVPHWPAACYASAERWLAPRRWDRPGDPPTPGWVGVFWSYLDRRSPHRGFRVVLAEWDGGLWKVIISHDANGLATAEAVRELAADLAYDLKPAGEQ